MHEPTFLRELTFLDALRKRPIVIPAIQRDYAQGRDTTQAANIRTAFVRRLDEAARDPGRALSLDLVYMAKDDKADWVPVDGQQRLTTLFLFHLYHLKDVSDLKRFSYAVRRSSQAFCEKVVERQPDWKGLVEGGQYPTPSAAIRDQVWFLSAWERDPTVKGMLQTLDTIHGEAKQKAPLPEGWERNITFWGYEPEGDADVIYRELNARGKPLTPFENLKAFIDGRPGVTKDWRTNIDGAWLDAIWGAVEKTEDPESACDTALLTLTVATLLVRAVAKGSVSEETDVQEALAVLMDPNAWLSDNLRERLCDDAAPEALDRDFGKVAQDGGKEAADRMTAPWETGASSRSSTNLRG